MLSGAIRTKNKQFEKIETNDIDDIEDEEEQQQQPIDGKQQKIAASTLSNKGKTFNKQKFALFLISITILLLCIGAVIGYVMGVIIYHDNADSDGKYNADNYYIRDPQCLDRKCCKSIDIANNSANAECTDFSLFECIFDAAWCEWDCDYTDRKTKNKSYVPMRTTQRVFHGISTGIGKYRENYGSYAGVLNEDKNADKFMYPSSPYDVMEHSKMISIDDCGIMYEETVLQYDAATKQFEAFVRSNASRSDDDEDEGTRRRMQSGIIGSDDQTSIGQSSGSLGYPDNTVGCITYYAYDAANTGYDYTDPHYYNKICSGTFLSPWHVLTAAHCCYPYQGWNFYANWYVYPKIAWYSQLGPYRTGHGYARAYKVRYARIYLQWQFYHNYAYDYCILTLWYPYYHYYNQQLTYGQIGYNIDPYLTSVTLSSHHHFNTIGYRYDKYSPTINNGYLIYGWKNKAITRYTPNYFEFTSTAYHHGFGGAPIYYNYNQINKVYCVVSQFGYTHNKCVRITQFVYVEFCTIIGEYNTWSTSYNQYCLP